MRVLQPIITYPDVSPPASVARALDMAATLEAHVTALVLEVDIPPIGNPVADLLLDLQKEAAAAERLSRETGERVANEIESVCHRLRVPLLLETLKSQRPHGDLVAERARAYDLTLLASLPGSPDHALLAEDVLFGSGGPVIVFPADEIPVHVETVAVAWDGTRAASRALHDAMPILRRASKVRLLSCTEDKQIAAASIDGVLALLAAHEMAVTHVPVELDGRPIGEALQAAASAQDAGLLVMGAYGHSRLREFVLGGATSSALALPKLPLFMSH